MRVVVAGAGVIGLWCARELVAAGADVVLVGPSGHVPRSTPASAGWVVPMLSAPLSGPGFVRDAAGQVLRREAAFSFRGMSPELARWMWSFVRSGTAHQFRHGLRATLELAADCQEQFHALRAQGLDFELHPTGLLMVARTDEGAREAQHLVESSAGAGYDGKSDQLDSNELLEVEPALAGGLAGGVYARDELHVHPEQLIGALLGDAVAKGVTVRDAVVDSIVPAKGGRWTVVTSEGRLEADKVVIAAGYWSRHLAASLGVALPIQSGAGFSVTATGPRPPALPLKLVEANVAVTPFDGGVRLAGRFVLGPPPQNVSRRQIARIAAAAGPYFREWQPTHVSAEHVGLRPATPDSLPIIGELPGRPGVVVATGHGMLGLTLAPGTAAEVLHQVYNGAPTAVGSPFAVERFRSGTVG